MNHFNFCRILLLASLLTTMIADSYAQNSNMNPTSDNPLNTYINNYVQPPPNAASLGKYADFPIGYYTGVPQISVPIYNLKDGGINLPISLSYHASGIRVSEIASWVGLGWALNATGVINRTVRGTPDEGSHKAVYSPNGYYLSHGLFMLPTMLYPLPGSNNLSDPQGVFWNTSVNGILNGGTDGEPDLYTFNFNGHVGKFVFDEKGTPRLLEDDNLKIRVIANAAHTYFNSWVITTSDGVEYFFGENGATEMVRPVVNNRAEDLDDAAPSSWYLTRIYNPNTKETATFNYVNEGYSYNDLGPESKLYGGGNGIQTDVSFATNTALINSHGGVDNFISTSVQGLKLTSIVTNNFTVNFIAATTRLDVSSLFNGNWKNPDNTYNSNPVYSPPCSLDSITVYTNQKNVCIRRFALGHAYFNSTQNGTSSVVLASTNDVHDTQRLKLTSVVEISGDNIIRKPAYTFSYQESFQLPRRLSYDQDHWGFSNNIPGNFNSYFTPPTFSSYSTYTGGAYRHPRWPDMSAFTLMNITDPLGVSTAFTFGANSANNSVDPDVNPSVADTLVGGLRIEKIVVTDNVTGTAQTRSFGYKVPNGSQPGGNVTHMPIYLTQLFNEYFEDVYSQKAATQAAGFVSDSYRLFSFNNGFGVQIIKQSQSIVPMQDANGNHIIYPYVKEVFGISSVGGYKMYNFATDPPTAPDLISRLDVTNYTALGNMNYQAYGLISGYYGNGHFNDTTASPAMLPANLVYSTDFLATGPNGFPAAPSQIDLISGKLLEEDTYDSSNNLIESTTNTYSTAYHENFWMRGLKAYVQNLIPYQTINNTNYTNTPALYSGLTFYKLHTGVSHLTSTVKKTYNGSNAVTITTQYAYESPYHTLKTSETTMDSQGNSLVSKTYYTFDYNPSVTSDNVFGKMKTRNLLLPVRQDSWKNSNLIGEKITTYLDFATASTDTIINPVNVYALETVSPLTATQANESQTWSALQTVLIPNSNLISKVTYGFDGTTGRPTNQQLANDKAQGIMWSNQLKLPVAIVDNAANTTTLKEFYYEGFEESTTANLYNGSGHTGTKSVFAPYTVTWTVPNSRKYVTSYWYLINGIWKLQPEQPFTGSLTLSGGTQFDDIRIYPSDANMMTNTYDAAGDLTSTIDAKGETKYYEYDGLQRLVNIKDKDGNIVKNICYNYSGQPTGCNVFPTVYSNTPRAQLYNKNNCGNGYSGSGVTYTIPAALYTSTISQADADNKATADLQANGITYANINGSCIQNINISISNTTNSGYQVNFSNSTTNLSYNFSNNGSTAISVPAGTYSVNIYPTGAYINHTITCGSQSVSAPRNTFTGVIVASGNGLAISVY